MKRPSMTCLLTYRCNYDCPYCDQAREKLHLQYSEILPEFWIRFFNSCPKSLILLSGGEPFLYKGFLDILEQMPKKHVFYLATNLSLSVRGFLDVADPKQVIVVAASLHPSSPKFQLKPFLEKVSLLQQHGFPVSVIFVAYPDQMHLIQRFKLMVEGLGAIFQIEPFISKTYQYTREEEEYLKEWIVQGRKMNWNWTEDEKVKFCSAGQDYFFVVPTGATYRCFSGFTHHHRSEFYIGNIAATVKIERTSRLCLNSCPAVCDQNAVTVYNDAGQVISKPMYPSESVLMLGKFLAKRKCLRQLWKSLPQDKIMHMVT